MAYQRRPPRFAYELSDEAADLAEALRLLAGWGARDAEDAPVPRHEACGTPLEVCFWCPHCEQPVDRGEASDVHYA